MAVELAQLRSGRGLSAVAGTGVHLRSVAVHQVLSVPAAMLGGGLWLALTADQRYRVNRFGWLLCMLAILVAQLLVAAAMLRSSRLRAGRPATRLVGALFAMAFLDGAIWGAIPVLLHPASLSWELWLLTTLFLLGITAGAMGSMQGVRGLFVTLVIPLWVPAMATMWAQHDRRTNLLLLGVVALVGLLIYFTTYGNRVTRELAELQEHHADLVDKLRLSETRMRDLAIRDPLTGLLNRNGFAEAFDALVPDGRLGNFAVHLLVIDLDRFKGVNDGHGHTAGDRLLVTAGERIEKVVAGRGIEAQVGRWGGDEFVASVSGLDDEALAVLVDQLTVALSSPFDVGSGTLVSVGASIGVARAGPSDTFADLFIAADRGMYVAKQARASAPINDNASTSHS